MGDWYHTPAKIRIGVVINGPRHRKVCAGQTGTQKRVAGDVGSNDAVVQRWEITRKVTSQQRILLDHKLLPNSGALCIQPIGKHVGCVEIKLLGPDRVIAPVSLAMQIQHKTYVEQPEYAQNNAHEQFAISTRSVHI